MSCYKNICLVDTPYALSIYLLKMQMEDIKETLFFIGDSVNINIVQTLPHYVFIKNQSAKSDWRYQSWLRIYKYIRCINYMFANLYVQDHLYIASQFIGSYKYVNLPDGPKCYSTWEKSPYQPQKYTPTNLKQKIKNFLSHGKMYDLKYGCNDQCICRWIMSPEDQKSIYIQNKEFLQLDASKLWKEADNEKREFIRNVFGISDELMGQCSFIDTLILSQPLREDCDLSDDEMYEVYAQYINNQPNVAIKTHPRDKFEWSKFFPNAYVINTYAPMQLLNYIGLIPKKAITVSSSSISAMPSNTKKIFIGTRINNKILRIYGDQCNQQ